MNMKNKSEVLTMEELEARPGYKEIKTRPMIQKDEAIKATETKDSYI